MKIISLHSEICYQQLLMACSKHVVVRVIFLALFIHHSISDFSKVKGHMEKLGSHRPALGLTMIGKFSNPAVFYGHFVAASKPLLMRSALETVNHPGLTEWTDTFLRAKFGNEPVKVEASKKEDRDKSSTWLSLRQFLNLYTTEDMYMVQTLNNKMEEFVLIPPNLQCGGFQKVIQEAVMWLGSDEAKSVLHFDELDNLLCLLDGQKDFVLIDKVYKPDIEEDGFVSSRGYSLVDVDKVDFQKFPRLATVPWHEAHLRKGDCIYIPNGWYHQVTSRSHRHLAINIWFSRRFWFNSGNCSDDTSFYKPLEPISSFGFASPNEVFRTKLLEKVYDKGILLEYVFVSSLDTSTEERRIQFFHAIDKYPDSVLSWSELYGFNIDQAVLKFPDIFGLPVGLISSTDEKIILYEPLPPYDQTDEQISEETGNASVDDSQDTLISETDSKSSLLPDDNAITAALAEKNTVHLENSYTNEDTTSDKDKLNNRDLKSAKKKDEL